MVGKACPHPVVAWLQCIEHMHLRVGAVMDKCTFVWAAASDYVVSACFLWDVWANGGLDGIVGCTWGQVHQAFQAAFMEVGWQ